jgi:hypothetical protein
MPSAAPQNTDPFEPDCRALTNGYRLAFFKQPTAVRSLIQLFYKSPEFVNALGVCRFIRQATTGGLGEAQTREFDEVELTRGVVSGISTEWS